MLNRQVAIFVVDDTQGILRITRDQGIVDIQLGQSCGAADLF